MTMTLEQAKKKMPIGSYKNNKTEEIYYVCGYSINCKNAQDGEIMVRYIGISESGDYVREINEFLEKFQKA